MITHNLFINYFILAPNFLTLTNILPFKAIRPVRDKAQLVATRPYYTYSRKMLNAKLIGNPYTFLHIINPEFHKQDKTKPNSDGRFLKVRQKFVEFFENDIFLQEEKAALYVYRQTTRDHEFIGFIGGADLKEYEEGKIKKHEETLTEREKTFSRYLDIVKFNAEPVLLFHKENNTIDELLIEISSHRAEYEYTTTDEIKHELWVVDDSEKIKLAQEAFAQLDETYIADGHHRCASSYRYYCTNHNKSVTNQHALAYYISESKLNILDFNRIVRDLNNHSTESFIEAVKTKFKVTKSKKKNLAPAKPGEITMYLENSWYLLKPDKSIIDKNHPVESLDTRILTRLILEPILDIHDLKTDDRIAFVSGNRGIKGLKKTVDKGLAKVAFGLYPVSTQQLKAVADANMIMPPKSTWIEPKLRSGLTIYPLD